MLLALTLALQAGLAASAPAVERPLERPPLEWTAPPQCPAAERGAELLTRFLGGRTPAVPVRIALTATARGYEATVELQGARRTLEARDCETLGRAAALVVAVSLDPVATARAVVPAEPELEPELAIIPEAPPSERPEASPPDLAIATSPRAPERTSPPQTRPSRRSSTARADAAPRPDPRAPDLGHSLGVSGGITRAHVPALTGAVRLSYAFDRGSLRLQADATYATPRRVTYPAEPTVGGRFQAVSVGGRACFVPGSARVLVPLCAGVEGGPVFGRGIGVEQTRRPVAAWVAALGSAAMLVRVHPRVAVGAGADLVASLRRPAFHVGARETLFRTPPVGLRAMAGLELRLR